ncbi:MAG: hypothetical protein V3V03_08540, partial [Hyphomonadaceae bacterium]
TGLLSAVYQAFQSDFIQNGAFSMEGLEAIGKPFLEGLSVAAYAPIAAVLLRNFASDNEDEYGDITDGLTTASDDLTASMIRAKMEIDRLSKKTETSSDSLEKSLIRASTAADKFATDLEGSLGGLGTSVTSLTGAINNMVTSLNDSGTAIVGTATNLDSLRAKTREATEMLETLSSTIEKIERFTVKDRTS